MMSSSPEPWLLLVAVGLVARDPSASAIARSLSFSISTIRHDTTSTHHKLQDKSCAEAIGKAIQHGLIAKPLE